MKSNNIHLLLRLMAYIIIILPATLAYVNNDPNSIGPWDILDMIVDGLFGCDIIINFFTCYFDHDENLIVDRKVQQVVK